MSSENAPLKEYLESQFLFQFSDQITPETNLFEAGLIDSFGFVELVSHLESTYSVSFDEDDFTSPMMTHLKGIETMIKTKRSQAGLDA